MKSANALRLAHWGKPVSQAQAGRGGGGQPGQGPGHAGPLLSLFHANGEGAEGGGQQRRHSRRAKRGRHPPSLPSQPGPLTDPPVEFKVANEGREEASQTGCKYPGAPSAAAGTGTDPRFVRGSPANAACGCRHTPVFVRVVPVEPATLPHPGKSPKLELVYTFLGWFPLSKSPRLPGVSPDPPKHAKDDHSPLSCSTDRYQWQNQILWSD